MRGHGTKPKTAAQQKNRATEMKMKCAASQGGTLGILCVRMVPVNMRKFTPSAELFRALIHMQAGKCGRMSRGLLRQTPAIL
jgi:hypothetical protein